MKKQGKYVQIAIKTINDHHENTFRKKVPRLAEKKIASYFESVTVNENYYYSIQANSDSVDKLVCGYKAFSTETKENVVNLAIPLWDLSKFKKKEIHEEFRRAGQYFGLSEINVSFMTLEKENVSILKHLKLLETGTHVGGIIQSVLKNLSNTKKVENIEIKRIANEAQVASLIKLEKKCILEEKSSLPNVLKKWNWSYSKKLFYDIVKNKSGYIAINSQKKIIGVIGYCKNLNLYNYPHITTFCVHPSYQRQGIGKELLREVLKNMSKNKHQFFVGTTTTKHLLNKLSRFGLKTLEKSYRISL